MQAPRIDYPKMFDLSGRVAVVTGASGMLGREIAIGLASCGANLVLSGRNKERLESGAGEVRDAGRKCLTVTGNVSLEEDVAKLAIEAKQEFGKIDILATCAAENFLYPAKDYPVKNWNRLMETNALGTFLSNREIGKVMLLQNSGKIINISSIRGSHATAANAIAYSASKAAVNMITKQLACEWGRYGITVNAVAPAMILSGMHMGSGEGKQIDQRILDSIAKRTPMKRLANPEDIVGTVIFLASSASNFVNGQIIYVDGGASAWAA